LTILVITAIRAGLQPIGPIASNRASHHA